MNIFDAPDGPRIVRRLPYDEDAARKVQSWVRHEVATFESGMDLRGADFTGSNLDMDHFFDCDMRGVVLRGAYLVRADLAGSDLTGADLTDAHLIKAEFDRTMLVEATLDRANFGRAELYHADVRSASFDGATLGGTDFLSVDARGASFADVQCFEASFYCTVDLSTTFRGMVGSMWGLVTVVDGDTETTIDGEELQRFLRDRGADVTILKARNPRKGTNEYGH